MFNIKRYLEHKELKLINIDDSCYEKFDNFLDILYIWNKKISLISSPKHQWLDRHLLDSLSIRDYILEPKKILDIGSGNGFPGIILAILYPKKNFTLLDSNSKKSLFLRFVVHELNLKNVNVHQERIENYYNTDSFDTIITRAFGSLKKILDVTNHLISVNTELLCMKAKLSELEVKEIDTSFTFDVSDLIVEGLSEKRVLVAIKKKNLLQ